MLKCKDCKLFSNISNTNESGQGICKFGFEWNTTHVDNNCPIIKEYHHTCKDCAHFGNDYACMTAASDDNADDCCGFIDKRETDFSCLLFELKARGIDYHKLVKELIEEIDEYEMPSKRKD